MKVLLLSALAAAMFAAAGVHAQETSAPGRAELDTVEVYGRNKKLGAEVHAYVSTLTQMDGELVSRWNTSICPKVVADDPAHAEYIRKRLHEVAAEIPFASDADPKCRANLFVVLTGNPEQFVEEWKKRDPGMFIWRPRRGVTRSAQALPVRTWHNVAVEPASDAPRVSGAAVPASGMKSSGLGSIPTIKSTGGGSRIVSTVSENLNSVLVLVDTHQAEGVTLRQLADYIAMVSFSKVDLEADFGQTNSILRLFAPDEGGVKPGSLTMWDIAFLRGLYRQSFEAVHQRTAISARMVRDLVENTPGETPP
jgi:hypothetical protein